MFGHRKLLLLIICIGLLIALFGKQNHQHDSKTPWNIQQLPDGYIHVLGITPGKTTMQETNLILGDFAETRLYNTDPAHLLATHENISLGAGSARIDLQYQIDDVELASLQQKSRIFSPCQYVTLDIEDEIALLNSPIEKIIYTPVHDYSLGTVEDHLGKADEIQQAGTNQQVLLYHALNLTIYLNSDRPDVFVYANPGSNQD